ncbi:MAG TPA: GNAT family N-acetyltransferase [Bryobacteraceae bacterium]|nr:GNAT family N-acetyltransferase [Bryobacteraceae bacterium]
MEFWAEVSPGAARAAELAALDPANPFATPAYLAAEQSFGAEPWLLGCVEGGKLGYGCLAFLRSGRLNRRLTISSLPAAEDTFWRGLREFSRAHHVGILELNTFASPPLSIPALGEQTSRMQRHEFLLRLGDPETSLLERMRVNHRQSARKGIKAGLVVRVTGDPAALDDHIRMIASSMGRRQARGETVSYQSSPDGLRPYLESGFCRLFLAVLGTEPVSSMLVARASEGAYLYTSGTAPAGMAVGASHFLMHEIALTSRREGARVFNLGGVGDLESSLAQYKRHFGAEPIALEAAEFYVGTAWRKAVNTGVRAAQGILRRLSRRSPHA